MIFRPFEIKVSEEDRLDFEQRLRQTRWPAQPHGIGWAAGMDGSSIRALTAYWLQKFNWRQIESDLNRLPQFQAITDLFRVPRATGFARARCASRHADQPARRRFARNQN